MMRKPGCQRACGSWPALFEQLLAQEYAKGSALNMAATLEIDPADTRDWVQKGLQGRPAVRSPGVLMVDAW